MTQQKSRDVGGSTLIENGTVKHAGGTLNPGDAGYTEAARKVPVQDKDHKGALSRAPSYRDLDQHTQEAREAEAKRASAASTKPSAPAATTGGKS